MFLLIHFIFFSLTLARVKYTGGDWYNDPSTLPNLATEINNRTTIKVAREEAVVSPGDKQIYNYPFLFLTGHGDIRLSDVEVENLRSYLIKGGFLYVDDDYGLDTAFRHEIKKVFPGLELEELPYTHPIFHSFYEFSYLPKIHKHDGKPPQCFGIFYQGRLVVLYTYETNISDGWVDAWVYNNPQEKREEAFRFGINIVVYALTSYLGY